MDLVVTDLVMPEHEGIETIQELRRKVTGVGIIAISGAFGGQFLKAAAMLGADAGLAKPVRSDVLLANVAEVLRRRPPGGTTPAAPQSSDRRSSKPGLSGSLQPTGGSQQIE